MHVSQFLICIGLVAAASYCEYGVAQSIEVGPGEEFTWSSGELFEIEVNGGTLHMTDGIVAFMNVKAAGEANISGGLVPNLDFQAGSRVNVTGGEVGFFTGFGGRAEFSEGLIASVISLESSSHLVQTGGKVSAFQIGVASQGVWEIHGGDPGFNSTELLVLQSGSQVDFYGSDFALDGVPITGLLQDTPHELLSRDTTLTGRLEDGTEFSLFLSASPPPGPVPNVAYVMPGAEIFITSVVPEPTWTGVTLLAVMGTRKRSR